VTGRELRDRIAAAFASLAARGFCLSPGARLPDVFAAGAPVATAQGAGDPPMTGIGPVVAADPAPRPAAHGAQPPIGGVQAVRIDHERGAPFGAADRRKDGRVVVMTSRPGRITEMIDVDLPRERTLDAMNGPAFGDCVRRMRAHFGSFVATD
jgi:hypothetical protein